MRSLSDAVAWNANALGFERNEPAIDVLPKLGVGGRKLSTNRSVVRSQGSDSIDRFLVQDQHVTAKIPRFVAEPVNRALEAADSYVEAPNV